VTPKEPIVKKYINKHDNFFVLVEGLQSGFGLKKGLAELPKG
jgi:hypothetical protein